MSGLGIFRTVKDCFGKGKFQHDLPVIVGDFQYGVEQIRLPAFRFQDFPNGCPRHVPCMIGIAKLLPFGVEDQLTADPGVEEISRQWMNSHLVGRASLQPGGAHAHFIVQFAALAEATCNTTFAAFKRKPLIDQSFIAQPLKFREFIFALQHGTRDK